MGIGVGIKSEHSKDCKFYVAVGHGQRGNSRLLTCACAKVVFWTEGKDERGKTKMGRKQFRTLADAEAFQTAKQAELNGTAAPALAAPAATVADAPQRGGKTVREAIVSFLGIKAKGFNKLTKERLSEGHVNSRLRPALTNFLRFVNRELAGANDAVQTLEQIPERGVLLSAITPEHVIQWSAQLAKDDGSEYSQNTKAKLVDMVAGFFKTAVKMNWLTRTPVTDDAKVPSPDHQEPKSLTDAQVEQFFAAIPKLPRNGDAEVLATLRAILLLMRWTGLSLQDAITLERTAIGPNGTPDFVKVQTARAKTNKPVFCTITREVAEKVLAGARTSGKYLFVESVPAGEKERKAFVALWGRRISQLGELADIKDENGEPLHPTSHWMRHTFVRWCFDNDISTEDVAELIGDNVATVAKHYSGWIHARQERLTEKMKAALTPKAEAATTGR